MPSPIPNAFPEEPLTLTEEEGFGFFPARLGMMFHSRYKILRKLGKGRNSSTWLVSNSPAEPFRKYRTIKILTAHATKRHHEGHRLELEIMQTIATLTTWPESYGLPRLFDHFEIDGPHGRHLCIVYHVLGQSVSDFRRSTPSKMLGPGPQKVKLIVAGVLDALIDLHAANIIHTDVKADNVVFADGTDPRSIEKFLDESPPIIDGEFELKGARYPIVRSQPIPNQPRWNDPSITRVKFSLFDRSQQRAMGRTIGTYALRAPEVILGADYGVKVDVWAVGCMAFELLTGHSLFHPQADKTWGAEDDHLAQMMGLTGEYFPHEVLSKCRKRDEYFDETGKLWRIRQLSPMTLERKMMDYGLQEADAANAGAFIRACLHLDPDRRHSAEDLATHPWLETTQICCDCQKL